MVENRCEYICLSRRLSAPERDVTQASQAAGASSCKTEAPQAEARAT
jgi:hypothetical protein